IVDGKARDAIARLRSKVLMENILTTEQVTEMERAALVEIDAAVAFGESSPFPAPEEALEDLFARGS
ncbi:MAG TPA: pyruvate dehydrogenase (acetyl-transferring) E1 component subunit alpha, partial [Candidatus Methylomirabilis sp.]|nr:pyruvate dehydrogenase (acetyl-transferring) E1 component subunit alpha [Candidatus Methylomirabilis sp.]